MLVSVEKKEQNLLINAIQKRDKSLFFKHYNQRGFSLRNWDQIQSGLTWADSKSKTIEKEIQLIKKLYSKAKELKKNDSSEYENFFYGGPGNASLAKTYDVPTYKTDMGLYGFLGGISTIGLATWIYKFPNTYREDCKTTFFQKIFTWSLFAGLIYSFYKVFGMYSAEKRLKENKLKSACLFTEIIEPLHTAYKNMLNELKNQKEINK